MPRTLLPSVSECILSHLDSGEDQEMPDSVEGGYRLLELLPRCLGLVTPADTVLEEQSWKRGQVSRPKVSSDAFRQMEGTIVLHINFAVKQDPALGQELLYLVRTSSWPSTPFLVSVLLSIRRIQRFEQASFDLLKATAVRSYKDCQQCRESRLAASLLGARCVQTAREMEQSLMRTVQSSAFGWDHIIPSVVRLGFCLIESVGVGRPRADETSRALDQVSSTQDLGIRVLTAAFEVHEMARDEVFHLIDAIAWIFRKSLIVDVEVIDRVGELVSPAGFGSRFSVIRHVDPKNPSLWNCELRPGKNGGPKSVEDANENRDPNGGIT
ncbi:hypothetical protein R1sor_021677 [Riccia sorocarpa]|uniref:FANCI helical domain-containing protein n=1 Tax=Riccia sorocarpa TaxID=122646 RepID=A0ABD3GJE5_9MARC